MSIHVMGERTPVSARQHTPTDGSVALAPVVETETEFAKDVWDVRRLPGVRHNAHTADYLVNFTDVPLPFRPEVKRYCQVKLATRWSHSACRQNLRQLRTFFHFLLTRSPAIRTLHTLSADDITAYLQSLAARTTPQGRPLSAQQRNNAIRALDHFLRYLQRTDNPLAPQRSVDKIIWPEHITPCPWAISPQTKYIPHAMLEQLDQHLHHLPPRYLPVVVLLRASGWRISDVLNLRYDSCLERTESGWFLCGDILKTRVLGHKIPITEEIAALVLAQRALVTQTCRPDDNPARYLFPSPYRQRRGHPFLARLISNALNRLAVRYEIRGEDGIIFRFRTHAFRHTKAVELLNNGMGLVYVQQWMAHLSPEMTLVYAKVLDDRMRQQWEHAMAQGAVRIDGAGGPYPVAAATVSEGDELDLAHVRGTLDAIRLPHGYCFKHKSFECPAARMPCYTCHAFVTTPAFLDQFEREIHDTEQQIELGEAAGRPHWVEANRRKLTVLQPIVSLLRQGALHQPMDKNFRQSSGAEIAERSAPREKGG